MPTVNWTSIRNKEYDSVWIFMYDAPGFHVNHITHRIYILLLIALFNFFWVGYALQPNRTILIGLIHQ